MLLKTNSISDFVASISDEVNKAAWMLTENLQNPNWGHSDSPVHTPFTSWSKYPGTFFSWYQDEDSWGAARVTHFKLTMKEWTAVTEASTVVDELDDTTRWRW
ncbi:hypothetical protein EV421DRAFT_1907416 [Armillaria borealis]|uniref:Uncharacterized protein n=1 Tax=Armillaria borealis TaxID=47425 RepID=A0AA39MKT5_9AGAR|nr:hypothetical protein EV421DRAFT_1907416 [Armillaria borealis]